MGDGDAHSHDNLPLLLAGGGGGRLQPGRHVQLGQPRPLANLFVELAQGVGIDCRQLSSTTVTGRRRRCEPPDPSSGWMLPTGGRFQAMPGIDATPAAIHPRLDAPLPSCCCYCCLHPRGGALPADSGTGTSDPVRPFPFWPLTDEEEVLWQAAERPPLTGSDLDGDGITDEDEQILLLDALDAQDGFADIDGDGLHEAWEWDVGSDPEDPWDPEGQWQPTLEIPAFPSVVQADEPVLILQSDLDPAREGTVRRHPHYEPPFSYRFRSEAEGWHGIGGLIEVWDFEEGGRIAIELESSGAGAGITRTISLAPGIHYRAVWEHCSRLPFAATDPNLNPADSGYSFIAKVGDEEVARVDFDAPSPNWNQIMMTVSLPSTTARCWHSLLSAFFLPALCYPSELKPLPPVAPAAEPAEVPRAMAASSLIPPAELLPFLQDQRIEANDLPSESVRFYFLAGVIQQVIDNMVLPEGDVYLSIDVSDLGLMTGVDVEGVEDPVIRAEYQRRLDQNAKNSRAAIAWDASEDFLLPLWQRMEQIVAEEEDPDQRRILQNALDHLKEARRAAQNPAREENPEAEANGQD